MKTKLRTNLDTSIRAEAWMQIDNDDLTIEDAILKLKELGNEVIGVDELNRRIQVLDQESCLEEVVYVCEYCDAYSLNEDKIMEHEKQCKTVGV